MKISSVSYSQWKALLASKGMLPQYSEDAGGYDLFAVEGSISWETRILKDGGSEQTDFEANIKPTANAPLEYRSTDGLPKVASAMFTDNLSYWVDGVNGNLTVAAGQTGYMKTHFSTDFRLNGVDVHWLSANFGDYINFEVGVYSGNNPAQENTFMPLVKFGDHYRIVGDGTKTFNVDTVKVVPSTYSGLDVYVRTTYVNAGANSVSVCVNLLGYR